MHAIPLKELSTHCSLFIASEAGWNPRREEWLLRSPMRFRGSVQIVPNKKIWLRPSGRPEHYAREVPHSGESQEDRVSR